MRGLVLLSAVLALTAGCAGYSWRSTVPEAMRTVSVPNFRNETDVTELGDVVARQALREFQREGTFRLAAPGEAALEVQGVLTGGGTEVVGYMRETAGRNVERRLSVKATVSFIDKKSGKVLVDDRRYSAVTTFLTGGDVMTGARDASGRLAEELARQIVDDALTLWENGAGERKGAAE